jgi:acetoacetyl-CoA synthetase
MFTNSYHYGGKFIDISEKNIEVMGRLESIEYKFLMNYPEMNVTTNNFDIDLETIFSNKDLNNEILFEKNFFNDPMYILYSSGTTGKPKCIIHNTGGPLIQHMKEQQLHCDLKKNDKIFYFTTCGWMMWNWLITALSSNASILLYDGSPFFPEKDSLFKIAEEEKLDIFGVSAKYIDALRNFQISIKDNFCLESLKCILSTGSPLSSDCFKYVYESIKEDVHLASISGGTDIVSCFVAGNPNLPVYPGEIQVKCLGVDADIFDEHGNKTKDKGELVCKSSIPSMPIGFWNDPNKKKYITSYFSTFENIWSQGDFAQYTNNSGIVIYGRSDATLNPGGIRIGTAEIYRGVESFEEINESVVVGQIWNDDVRIILFVTLNSNFKLDQSLISRIEKKIKEATSIRHVPSKIILVSDIPRTRSGKISELSVRDTINNIKIKNLEALANPECLNQYQNIEELKK